MELMFLLGIHHVARIRRIRCRMGPPPMDFLPPDKIPYDKSFPSMGFFSPPPLPKQAAHAVPIVYMEFVLEEICHGISSGGKACHMVLFPLGKLCYGISSGGRFAIWYSFRGNVCHMVLFQRGQSPMVFVPLS